MSKKDGKINVGNYRIGKYKYDFTMHAHMVERGKEEETLTMIMKQAKVNEEEAKAVIEDLKLYNQQVEEEKNVTKKKKSKKPLIIVLIIIALLVGGGYIAYQKIFVAPDSAKATVEQTAEYNTGEYKDAVVTVYRDDMQTEGAMAYQKYWMSPSPLGTVMYKNNKDNGAFLKVTPTKFTQLICEDGDGKISSGGFDYLPVIEREENGYASAMVTEFDVKAMTQEDFEKEISNSLDENLFDLNLDKMNESCWESVYDILNVSPKTAGIKNRKYGFDEFIRANHETWVDAYKNHGITTKTNSIDFVGATIVEYDESTEYESMFDGCDFDMSFISQMITKACDREKDHIFACLYKASVTTTEMDSEVAGLNYIPAKGETEDVYVVVTGVFNEKGEISAGCGGICGIAPLYDEEVNGNDFELNEFNFVPESYLREHITMDFMMD